MFRSFRLKQEACQAGSDTDKMVRLPKRSVDVSKSALTQCLLVLHALDTDLARSLTEGHIKLVRVSWLLSQADDFRMPTRQDLEALDAQQRPEKERALLSGSEAERMILDDHPRSVGVMSCPWLTPEDPDPEGWWVGLLRRFLQKHTYIRALFWDRASIFQPRPGGGRTPEERVSFLRSLSVMCDLFSSVVGTTVLQFVDIPVRPPEYDGLVCLIGLKDGVDAAHIRRELGLAVVGVDSCVIEGARSAVVHYSSHKQAVAAVKRGPLGLCNHVRELYNGRPYHDRGWCLFEHYLSYALMLLLGADHKVQQTLQALPPKRIVVSSTDEVYDDPEPGEISVRQALDLIQDAAFTTASDKELVLDMYRKFVLRQVQIMQKMFTFVCTDSSRKMNLTAWQGKVSNDGIVPRVEEEVKLEKALLLVFKEDSNWKDGHEGKTEVCVVESPWLLKNVLTRRKLPIKESEWSCAVLPWKIDAANVQEEPQNNSGRLDASYDALAQRIAELQGLKHRLEGIFKGIASPKLTGRKSSYTNLLRKKIRKNSLGSFRVATREEDSTNWNDEFRDLLEDMNDHELLTQLPPEGLRQMYSRKDEIINSDDMKMLKENVKLLMKTFKPNNIATTALRNSGALGIRQYARGQKLMFHRDDGWHVAEVLTPGTMHELHDPAGTVKWPPIFLHPWNHAPCELPEEAFSAALEWYMHSSLRDQCGSIDTLSGRDLDTLEHCVEMDIVPVFPADGDGDDLDDIRTVTDLASWCTSTHAKLLRGGPQDSPSAVLVVGPPAAGKTTLMRQLAMLMRNGSDLIPVFIKAGMLHAWLAKAQDRFDRGWNWVDTYLWMEYGESSPVVYRMLRQAMMARRVLLLIDGIDEGGEWCAETQEHLARVLAVQGHIVVASSRPDVTPCPNIEHVEEDIMGYMRCCGFKVMQLKPLHVDQQCQVLEKRLGQESMLEIKEWLETLPLDPETGQLVTANPLILSMVVAVFHSRGRPGMPSTVPALYEAASDIMLRDDDVDAGAVKDLLQAVFLESHIKKAPVIGMTELESSLGADDPIALFILCERVLQNRLPLMSLHQMDPLQMEPVHISFQEYFAARAICQGVDLARLEPPWRWSAFWANVVHLGSQMGDQFSRRLLAASKMDKAVIDLSDHMIEDARTCTAALSQMMRVAQWQTLKLQENSIGDHGAVHLATGLAFKAHQTIVTLDLSECSVGDKGAKKLGVALSANGTLRDLMLGRNEIGNRGANGLSVGLIQNKSLSFLDLSGNSIRAQGAKKLAEALKINATLETLRLDDNGIGPDGAIQVANMLGANKRLQCVGLEGNLICLPFNNIGNKAIVALFEGVRQNRTLTILELDRNRIGKDGARVLADIGNVLEENARSTPSGLRRTGASSRPPERSRVHPEGHLAVPVQNQPLQGDRLQRPLKVDRGGGSFISTFLS